MNEELKEQAILALSEILNLALKTKDFVVEQAPDVVQQLLAWNFTISLLQHILFALLLGGPLTYGLYVLFRRPYRDSIDYPGGRPDYFFSYLVGGMTSVFSILFLLMALSASNWIWLKIWIAPKLFLMEYAADLVK